MAKVNKKAEEENTALSFLAGDDTSHIDHNSNEGNESVRNEDLQVPRLKLAQLISDEVKNGDPAFIEDCKAGDYFHSATRQLFGKEFYAINVYYKMVYNVWRDRKNNGGGLVASCSSQIEAQEALNEACVADRIPLDDKELIEKNFQLKPTGVHYLIIIDAKTGERTPVIFDMDGSKLSVSKKWNSTIKGLGGARYSHVWKVTSFMDSNDRNEQYYNTAFEDMGFVNKDLMLEAKEAYENIKYDVEQELLGHAQEQKALEDNS